LPNLFNSLGDKKQRFPKGEEVEGTFSCQKRGCYERATVATYFDKEKLITWKCPEGHINSIEDFRL
jgi:hypothetical protein